MRFPIEVILVCIRWYAAYPLSCRHLEEMMEECGVDKEGNTIDFLLTAKRDKAAAMRFFKKAINSNDMPEKVAPDQIIKDNDTSIVVRQNTSTISWNKTIEQ